MKPLMNIENYLHLTETVKRLDKELDELLPESTLGDIADTASNMGAAFGSPIKYTKIKNNIKKYQKALVQRSINDLDFEKKKARSGKEDPKQKAILAAANKAKNQALKDQADAISDRMEDLSTTDALKAVARLGKNRAKLEAAKIVAKVASGEEAKALKLKINKYETKIAHDKSSLKDYEKKEEEKADKKEKKEAGGKEITPGTTKKSVKKSTKGEGGKEITPGPAKEEEEEETKAQNASFQAFNNKNNSYKTIHESVKDKFQRLLNEKRSV